MNQDYYYNTAQKLLGTEQTGKNVFIISSTLLAAFPLYTDIKIASISDKFNASEVVSGKDVLFLYT